MIGQVARQQAIGRILQLWIGLAAVAASCHIAGLDWAFPVVATVIMAGFAMWLARQKPGVVLLTLLTRRLLVWIPCWLIVGAGALMTSDGNSILHSGHGPQALLRGLLAYVAAPISEETIFRGWLLETLLRASKDRYRPLWISVSAVSFGLFHAVNLFVDGSFLACAMDVISATAFGLLISFWYILSRNLNGAIITHMIGNILTYAA